MRSRVVFVSASLAVVLLFAGLVVASREAREGLFQALGNLAHVIHLVQNEYVDQLNPEALELSLDAGIVESIDRWSAVLTDQEVERFQELTRSPPPFGLDVIGRLSSAAVRHVVPGSPAAAAGLQQWEVLEKVNGIYTRGRPLWQVRLELAGRERSSQQVTLTVLDVNVEQRREVILDAVPWKPEPVTVERRDGIAVLRLDGLPAGTSERVTSVVEPQPSLVLDLRHLAWGLEDEAVALADLFVAEGILGSWRGRRAGAKTFEATAPSLLAVPPMVLVGPDTEGVGEILAAALQRNGSTLVGGRTVGHAPQMRMIREDGVNLWIPTGQWLRADDQPITGQGLEPDEAVESPADDAAATGDPVLERALELLVAALDKAA